MRPQKHSKLSGQPYEFLKSCLFGLNRCRILTVWSEIYGVFKSLASLECRHLGCFDLNCRPSLRVTTLTCCALLGCKCTETNEYDRIAFLKRVSDGINHGIYHASGCSFWNVSTCSNSID